MHDLSSLSAQIFEPYQGKQFVLENTNGGVEPRQIPCDLVNVQRSPHGRPGGREPFSLLFRGEHGLTPGPGFHVARSGDFETPPIYVSRVTLPFPRPGEEGFAYYEAVFN